MNSSISAAVLTPASVSLASMTLRRLKRSLSAPAHGAERTAGSVLLSSTSANCVTEPLA